MTAAEPRSVAEREAHEQPGAIGRLIGSTEGRLVDPEGGNGVDHVSELVGDDVGIDGAGASAEEAAVHVVEDE